MKDLSIIIPAFGLDDSIGLWATIEACVFDLKDSGLSYDFRICVNGVNQLEEELEVVRKSLIKAGLVGQWIHSKEAQCPARARQLLARNCDSKYLFFFDNHCIPCHGYFKRGVETMEKYSVDLLHSVTKLFTGYRCDYEYKLTLEKNFWADEGYETPVKNEPYPIAAAGHGGIVIRNSTFKEVGGYWEGFNGYAGEEIYLDLKLWMMGKQVWIDPEFIHAHWAARRKYQRRSSEGYFINMLMAANIIGGGEWANKVFNYIKNWDVMPQPTNVIVSSGDILDIDQFVNESEKNVNIVSRISDDYLIRAKKLSSEHAFWLAKNRKRTLDELLDFFKKTGIRT